MSAQLNVKIARPFSTASKMLQVRVSVVPESGGRRNLSITAPEEESIEATAQALHDKLFKSVLCRDIILKHDFTPEYVQEELLAELKKQQETAA